MRLVVAVLLVAPSAAYLTCPTLRSTLAPAAHRATAPQLFTNGAGGGGGREYGVSEEIEVWRLREGMVRGLYGVLVNWKEDEREEAAEREGSERDPAEATRSAFIASAGVVVVGALVLRLGGRAALVSLLGLDFVAEMGLGDQIDQVTSIAAQLGPLAIIGFVGAWCVAKVFLLDVISIALAFSSGILFGGVFEGALLSAAGATIGSLVAFQLSRGALQSRAEEAIAEQPVARALAKVVEEDGFRTVFVLRLAPIIPALPLGAYSYVYGASSLRWPTFAFATFLGSIKPYLIDSYAGVFSKQIIDGAELGSSRDLILLIGLGVLVLVGTFATDLAGEIFDNVQTEVKAEETRRIAAGLDPTTGLTPEETAAKEAAKSKGLVLGPLNTTQVAEWLDANAFVGLRNEADGVWEQLLAFNAYQWEPAAKQAMAGRRKRDDEEAAPMPGADSENPIERLMASLATPALADYEVAPGATPAAPGSPTPSGVLSAERPSAATFFYGEDEASEADMAERKRRAEWSLEGGPGRIALTSLLYTFAMFRAAKEEWDRYPVDEEAFAQAAWARDENVCVEEPAEEVVMGAFEEGGDKYP